MAGSSSRCTGSDWTPLVFGTSASERLIDARFDIALGLTADRREFGDHQVT